MPGIWLPRAQRFFCQSRLSLRSGAQSRDYRKEWIKHHRCFYLIAGITIQVDSDLPILDGAFHQKFKAFQTDGPGEDTVSIHHHFSLPDIHVQKLGREVYRKSPWAIFRKDHSWIYLGGISPEGGNEDVQRVVVFNNDHSHAHIYNHNDEIFRGGGLHSLTMFSTDQILIGRLLADRQGCYLHSAGAIINEAGILFVGHSDAGKSTLTQLLLNAGTGRRYDDSEPMQIEILCDDRNIVRRGDEGWRVYGTWSHGDIKVISSSSAPLRAICFIEKANVNMFTPLVDRQEIIRRLLACVIRPFINDEWWRKTLDVMELLARETSYYVMRFDKSGAIVKELSQLISVVSPASRAADRALLNVDGD